MNRPFSANYDAAESVVSADMPCREVEAPILYRRKATLLAGIGLVALLAVGAAFHFDDAIQNLAHEYTNQSVLSLARWIGRWGDFGGVAAFAIAVWAIARQCCRRRVQYWIHVMLVAAVLSGLSANVVRVLCGRTRPNSGLVDGWHGPRAALDFLHAPHRFHAFPSAHTAVVAGFLSPVLAAVARRRRWSTARGLLALGAFSGMILMAFARVWSGAHHFSDVLAALLFGCLWGSVIAQHRPLARWRAHVPKWCNALRRERQQP